jgi:hypothetical protein
MQIPRRKTVYIAAWILFGLSLISGSVIADAITFSRQLDEGGSRRTASSASFSSSSAFSRI